MHKRALTLIELCLIIAIFAILLAAVIPSFTDADVAAKVTQARNDLRSIGSALEAYRRDYPCYPLDPIYFSIFGRGGSNLTAPSPILKPLTTPLSYIAAIPNEVFPKSGIVWYPDPSSQHYNYRASDWMVSTMMFNPLPNRTTDSWALVSNGPDSISNQGELLLFGEDVLNQNLGAIEFKVGPGCLYDPTNGAVSAGDLVLLHEDMLTTTSARNWEGYR